MTELDRRAIAELLAEIAERLKWAHHDLAMVIEAGYDREVVERARDDFEVCASQHRQLLVAFEQLRRSPQRSRGNGRSPDADASPAT